MPVLGPATWKIMLAGLLLVTGAAALGQTAAPVASGDSIPAATSWQHAGSDIPADPAWRTGTLANGVRYAVRRNPKPAGAASIRIRLDVGALMESDAQQGWAHFLEHMVFRGTRTLADGEGVRIWQRMGASFGTDSNAHTSQTATTYELDLPKADGAAIDSATGILADMMQNATIDPKSVEIERKVVLAERALRLTPLSEKFRVASEAVILPGLLAGRRNIAGNPETLAAASAEGLRSFYHRWYRPERAVVVIVGDTDPAELEAAVKKAFGGWQASNPRPSEPDYGALQMPALPVAVVSDPQAPSALQLFWIRPHDERPWTLARVQNAFVEEAAIGILQRRLATEAQGGGAILSAGARRGSGPHSIDQTVIFAMPKAGDWHAALDRVFAVLNGALAEPPSQGEVDQQLSRMRESYAGSATSRETEGSAALADTFIGDVDSGDVSASRIFYRNAFNAMRPTIKPALIAATLHRLFAADPRLILASKDAVAGDSAAVATALAGARKVAASARTEVRSVSINELALPGPAGKAVATMALPAFGAERVRFSNGVELVLKKTAIEKQAIRVQVLIGRGVLNQDQDEPVLSWSSPALLESGLGPFTADELTKLSAGRQTGFAVRSTYKGLVLATRTDPHDLPDTLRLMTGLLTQPHFAASSLQRLKSSFEASYQTIFGQPGSVLGAFAERYDYRGDKRFPGIPDPKQVSGLTLDAFKAYWTARLAAGPIRIVAVGDFNRDALVAAVGASFGALPPRPDRPPTPAQLDIRPSAPAAAPIILNHRGGAGQAIVLRVWPTTGVYGDIAESRALRLAASIIETRLVEDFREKTGGTYSPFVSSGQSEDLAHYGTFKAGVQLDVARIPDFEAALDSAIADLSVRGVDADALNRAKTPMISGFARAKGSSNDFWLGYLSGNLDDPRVTSSFLGIEAGYAAITPAQVQAAVVKYLRPGGSYELRVLPEK
ncbi:MAG: insulinase family protein [Sphingomonas sp.]